MTEIMSRGKKPDSYHVHVDAICVCPCMLEVLLQSLSQWVRDLVEANEFFDPKHLQMVPSCS